VSSRDAARGIVFVERTHQFHGTEVTMLASLMVRILVAGDIRLYRDGVAQYLERDPRFEVVGTASDRASARQSADGLRPDIVVLDMAMDESLAAVWDIARLVPETRIVALTVPDSEHAVITCAEAGIAGYVSRNGSLSDLVDAIEAAARGECVIPPKMVASLIRRVSMLAADRAAETAAAELTGREREIVDLIAQGLSNKQIGARLRIELATVKNHVHNILEKLHVHRRSDAVARARRLAPSARFPFTDDARRLEPRDKI
jgi:DNA-binding NarL/FixJ family response regulator